ncbi:MAG: hypothetical protein GX621_05145 [Pirellulaceae bacterium]|nr:hypothetical protein [Pirellulaceae bacterium]
MRRSREEFQRANPFRDPAWRANRVYALLYEGHEPSRRRDGELVHAYHKFVRRYLSIRGRKAYARLQASHPALLLVHELAMQEDREVPAILEAYLLTDLSLDEIAHRIGMTVEAATYYEQLFFCVRDRLDATDWILGLLCAQGDGEPPRPRDGTPTTADRHRFYKKMAYQGGHRILDIVIAVLSPHIVIPLSLAARDVDEAVRLRVKALYALESSPLATCNPLKLIQLNQKLAAQEASARQADSAPSFNVEAILAEFAACGIKIPNTPDAASTREGGRDGPN